MMQITESQLDAADCPVGFGVRGSEFIAQGSERKLLARVTLLPKIAGTGVSATSVSWVSRHWAQGFGLRVYGT